MAIINEDTFGFHYKKPVLGSNPSWVLIESSLTDLLICKAAFVFLRV